MPKRILILSQDDRWHKLEELGARIARWAEELDNVAAQISHDLEVLAGGELDACDVCVLCATMSDLTAGQEQGLVDWVAGGGTLLGIHSATVVDEKRTAYIELIGGRFTHHSPYHEFEVRIATVAGPTDEASTPGHPIVRGVDDFRIHDELYVLDRPPRGAHVLATASWEGADQPLVYTKGYGQGRVAYNALGHDQAAFDHPAFQKLVRQAIGWACVGAGLRTRPFRIDK
jgi:hypothetical protein